MKRRLIVLPYASPEPFRPLFDSVISLKHVDPESITEHDVVIYGGGTDINPSFYGERPHSQTQKPDIQRDHLEKTIFDFCVRRKVGFIGICRGAQFLTVLGGGKLIQHIGHDHCRSHEITDVLTGKKVEATSVHHQMMFPWALPEDKYQILAHASERLCKYYDRQGFTENYTEKEVPVEPEVVWYPHIKALCIQGHPEYVGNKDPFAKYCLDLVAERLVQ